MFDTEFITVRLKMSSLGTFRNLYCIISKAMRSGRFFSRTGSILAQSARKAGRNTPLNVNLLAQARHALDPNSAKTLLLGAALVAGLAVPLLGNASEPFEDIEAGASTDFVEGEMKQIQVGPDKENDIIIVFRVDGQLYATGAKCSHFGAPLAQGAFFGNIVVCPWHLAGFNVKTGAIENGPASDGIPTYEVREENGKVIVKAPKKITVNTKALPTVARDPNNKQRYVIIGGGPAGASAAEALRQSGFTGEILLLTAEDHLPYDRSALTKNLFKVQPDKIAIRGASAYESLGIEVRTGQLVTSLDPKKKEIVTKGGQSISYDKVLIATGGSPVKLNVPGANLQNIAAIRDFTDVNYIKNAVAAGAKEIVIVGGGLIGAEAASNIKLDFGDKVNVTVVSRHGILENHFGAEVSAAFEKLAKENGVHVVHDHVAAFKGDSTVTEVSLKSGQSVKADLVIQAVGVKPNTWFIKDGVQLDSDGGVNADPFLRSSTDKDVYAAGDVVSFPFHYTAERIRFEHLTEAYGLGFHAAWNMLGKMVPYGNIPFYWTRQYNKSVACVGHLKGYDRIIVDGKPTDYNFCAYYIKGNKVIGAAGMMRGKDLMTLSHAMRVGVPVTTDHFKGTALDLQAVAGSFKSKKCACNRAGHSAAPPKA